MVLIVNCTSKTAKVIVSENSSCFMSTTITDYDIIPANDKIKIFEAFINNRKNRQNFLRLLPFKKTYKTATYAE